MKTIGIFMAGQNGDQMSALSVMRYREELWWDAKIVWYSAIENFDNFKYQDIEVREFPRGFGYPVMVHEENKKLVDAGKEPIWEDWLPLVDENNHMNLSLKHNYTSLADIDFGYFPAPHQMTVEKRHGLSYPDCSKKVFHVPNEWEWHPVTKYSSEEIKNISDWMDTLPKTKIILFETFAGSDQSKMSNDMILNTINICKEKWDGCNIIFMSHKYLRNQEEFPKGFFNEDGIYSAEGLPVRLCGVLANFADLMISVSSGITVSCSAWGLKPIPILQFCGSWVCSTQSLALGHFELVTADNKTLEQAKEDFYARLTSLLNQYK